MYDFCCVLFILELLIFEHIFGITSTKNTAPNAGNMIHITSKYLGLVSGKVDIRNIKTIDKINSGWKFFGIFLIFFKVIAKSGMITIAKEWISISPNKNTRIAVIDDVLINVIIVILSSLIFDM